jgi:Fe-S cluster biogenesis protein NfuA
MKHQGPAAEVPMSEPTKPSDTTSWPRLEGPEARIAAILEEIRPYLQQDGGDLEFVSFGAGVVHLRLQGACGTCPSSVMTLKMGIENALREQVPEVQEVRTVE